MSPLQVPGQLDLPEGRSHALGHHAHHGGVDVLVGQALPLQQDAQGLLEGLAVPEGQLLGENWCGEVDGCL